MNDAKPRLATLARATPSAKYANNNKTLRILNFTTGVEGADGPAESMVALMIKKTKNGGLKLQKDDE